jgi:ribosome biogenesis GTPase
MTKGRVIYSSGGNYKVLAEGKVFDAKPRGIFRKDGIKILVGDLVELTINENNAELNTIDTLLERKNEFKRPNISNIDYAIIVASLVDPKLDTLLIDKFITIFQTNNIEPILIFTKYDLADNIDMSEVEEYKKAGYKVIVKHKDDPMILKE